MSLKVALDNFRYGTVVVTLAVMAFCVWITEGETVGRILAACVLAFGTLQFLVLTRLARREAAKTADVKTQMKSDEDDFESEPSSE